MNKLKITQAGFENYTGPLGPVEFVDGVSVEAVPVITADRLAAGMSLQKLDEAGNEIGQAGAAARMVGGVTIPAEVLTPLKNASEEDISADRRRVAEAQKRPPVSRIYSVNELKAIADEGGISALREVAKPWGVRERSIPKLIQEIMQAQGEFQKRIQEAEDKDNKAAAIIKVADDTAPLGFSILDPHTGADVEVTAPPLPPTQAADVEQPESEPEVETGEEKPADVPADEPGAADDAEEEAPKADTSAGEKQEEPAVPPVKSETNSED